jgi:hypothetical protein
LRFQSFEIVPRRRLGQFVKLRKHSWNSSLILLGPMRLPIQISEMSPNSKSCGTEHENYSTVFRQRHLSVTGLLIYLIFIINSKNTTSGICSSAKSKTHFSFETIIWSALASFHLNEKHTIQATCSTHNFNSCHVIYYLCTVY